MCHKKSSSEKFILPKNVGSVGIIDVLNLHSSQVKSLKNLLPQQEKYLSPILNYMWHDMLITLLLIYMILYNNKMQTLEQCKEEQQYGRAKPYMEDMLVILKHQMLIH